MNGNSLGLLHPITAGGSGLSNDLRRPGLGRHQLLDTGTAAHGWFGLSSLVVMPLVKVRRGWKGALPDLVPSKLFAYGDKC